MTTKLERYLADVTGLTLERAANLYHVGRAWPLLSTHEERRAAVYAQAHGVPLTEAMAAIEKASDAEHLEMLRLTAELEGAEDRPDLRQKTDALRSVPCLKEVFDHIDQVVSLTQETPSDIFRLWRAIQQFAIDHPDWDQDVESVGRPT